MQDHSSELRALRKAEADLKKATEAVLAQTRIVNQLLAHDHDARDAQQLLDTMQFGLALLERHRGQILQALEDIERGAAGAETPSQIAGPTQGMAASPARRNWKPGLHKLRNLLEQYETARLRNRSAQWEMLGTAADRERIRGLGQSEHETLASLLDEMARCARQCHWSEQEAQPVEGGGDASRKA